MSNILIEEFKGNKIIKIPTDENGQYFVSFGVKKAKAILDHIDDIKKFVEEYSKED